MNKIFELISNDNKQVVIKVNANDILTIAMNPYINSEYAYITVTKGPNHVLTVIRKDGTTFSFHWGAGGYTIISENSSRLKSEVIKFIEKDCLIPLELNYIPKQVNVFYNDNFKQWEITFETNNYGTACYFTNCTNNIDTICLADSIIDKILGIETECRRCWKQEIAQTGINVWRVRI